METEHISTTTAFFMIGFAVLIDATQAALDLAIIGFILDSVIDIVAAIIFGIWFSHYGISLMHKRPLGFLGTILGEFIPGIDVIPFWTYFVVTTILKERAAAQEGI